MSIGDKIRHYRSKKGLSQENVADSLKIKQSTYGKIESGKTKVTVDRLFELAPILDFDVAEILGLQLQESDHVEHFKKLAKDADENMLAWRRQAMALIDLNGTLAEEIDTLKEEIAALKKSPDKLASISTDLTVGVKGKEKKTIKH